MPLPQSCDRELYHSRNIEFKGYKRSDGLWDIEARMTDVKEHTFPSIDRGGQIEAGETFHDISLRFTINEEMEIKDAAASIDAAPFFLCPHAIDNIKNFVGLKIVAGFKKRVMETFPDVKGCTHIRDLAVILANGAFQTIYPLRLARRKKGEFEILNTCYALDAKKDVIKRDYPELHEKD